MTEKCTLLLPFSVHPNLPKTVHCQFLVTYLNLQYTLYYH